jgi:hypothetical protein
MRSFVAALVLLVISACGFTPLGGEITLLPVAVAKQPDRLTSVGTVGNGLLRDGCSYPITIGSSTYAASASTRALVESVASKRSGETKVSITYRVTGQVASVECGFGTKQQWPEIEVVAVTPINEVLSDVASIENGLAYDGCSYPISIAMTTYAPSASSKAQVESIASRKFGETKVQMTYRLTGAMEWVKCGEGSRLQYPEIEVLTLTALASTANVIIHHGLPFDGCSYPVELQSVRYAPSVASSGIVESFATRVGENKASIDYELTGATGTVACGRGTMQSLPEISVIAIRPRN